MTFVGRAELAAQQAAHEGLAERAGAAGDEDALAVEDIIRASAPSASHSSSIICGQTARRAEARDGTGPSRGVRMITGGSSADDRASSPSRVAQHVNRSSLLIGSATTW